MNTTSRMSYPNSSLAWLLLAALLPLLSGCFGAAALGLGAGALIATDRRPSETYVTDEGIELRAANRLREKLGDKVSVHVTSYNRNVLLTGSVPNAAAKAEAEKLTSSVPNVKAISNELQIAAAASYTEDAYITTKVKTRFVDSNQFAPNHVKVITEGGVVYLLGLVTRREADAAVEVTRTTAGVRKVVRVFEYIGDEQARQIDSQPPAGKAAPAAAQ